MNHSYWLAKLDIVVFLRKEEGWTGFSEGRQGCPEKYHEGRRPERNLEEQPWQSEEETKGKGCNKAISMYLTYWQMEINLMIENGWTLPQCFYMNPCNTFPVFAFVKKFLQFTLIVEPNHILIFLQCLGQAILPCAVCGSVYTLWFSKKINTFGNWNNTGKGLKSEKCKSLNHTWSFYSDNFNIFSFYGFLIIYNEY